MTTVTKQCCYRKYASKESGGKYREWKHCGQFISGGIKTWTQKQTTTVEVPVHTPKKQQQRNNLVLAAHEDMLGRLNVEASPPSPKKRTKKQLKYWPRGWFLKSGGIRCGWARQREISRKKVNNYKTKLRIPRKNIWKQKSKRQHRIRLRSRQALTLPEDGSRKVH